MSGLKFVTRDKDKWQILRNKKQIGWLHFREGMVSIDIIPAGGKPDQPSIAAVVYRGTAEDTEHALDLTADVCRIMDAATGCKDGDELLAKMIRDPSIPNTFPLSRLDLVVQLVNRLPVTVNKKQVTCPECNKPAEFDAFKIDFRGNRVCPHCQYNGNTAGIDFEDEDFLNSDWSALFGESFFIDDEEEEEEE